MTSLQRLLAPVLVPALAMAMGMALARPALAASQPLAQEAFEEAVKQGSRAALERLLSAGGDVDAPMLSKTGAQAGYPLLRACELGSLPAVQALIQHGADVNKVSGDAMRTRPVLLALAHGNAEMFRALVKAGAHLTWGDERGRHDGCLVRLLLSGNVSLFNFALNHGASPDALFCTKDGCTSPLNEAVRHGDMPATKNLILHDANPNFEADGATPLACAVRTGNLPVASLLLANGADPDKEGACPRLGKPRQPLAIALEQKDGRLAAELLRKGAALETIGNVQARMDLLRHAVRGDSMDLARALVRRGVAIEASGLLEEALHECRFGLFLRAVSLYEDIDAENPRGLSPLQLALGEDNRARSWFFVRELMRLGADIDARTRAGFSALEMATSLGPSAAANLVKMREDYLARSQNAHAPGTGEIFRDDDDETGADRQERVNDELYRSACVLAEEGESAYPVSVEDRYADIERLVLEGADPNATYNGYSAMRCSVESGSARVARFLLEHGGNPNIEDRQFGAPLILTTALQGNVLTARTLLEHGADIDAQDKNNSDILTYFAYGNVEEKDAAYLELILAYKKRLSPEQARMCREFASDMNIGDARRKALLKRINELSSATAREAGPESGSMTGPMSGLGAGKSAASGGQGSAGEARSLRPQALGDAADALGAGEGAEPPDGDPSATPESADLPAAAGKPDGAGIPAQASGPAQAGASGASAGTGGPDHSTDGQR